MNRQTHILFYLLCAFVLIGCTKSEVISSYEEVQESVPVPISFSPYIGSAQEDEATTRADVDYMLYSSYKTNNVNSLYDKFPVLGKKRNTATHVGSLTRNDCMIGVYGFYYNNNYQVDGRAMSWYDYVTDMISKTALTPNFMINQPVIHTDGSYYDPDQNKIINKTDVWEYSPIKYWPNNKYTNVASEQEKGYNTTQTDVVTFISYYPFQDYESLGRDATASPPGYYRDGKNPSEVTDANYANLTNIIPPAKDATGAAAYTFTFTQNDNVEKHIDFLLGINNDETKKNISSNVTLNLKHSLIAIQFGVFLEDLVRRTDTSPQTDQYVIQNAATTGKADPPVSELDYVDEIDFQVNYITLKNVSKGGSVTLAANYDTKNHKYTSNYWKWTASSNKKDYKLDFIYNTAFQSYKPYYKKRYDSSETVYKAEYNCIGDFRQLAQKDMGGPKTIMLIVPQNLRNRTIEVEYNLIYTYFSGDGVKHKVTYERQKESLNLPNTNDYDFSNSQGGKRITVNLKFYLKGVEMWANLSDWYYNPDMQSDDRTVEELEPTTPSGGGGS